MELKYKEGDIIFVTNDIDLMYEVVRVNFPIAGLYMIKHVTTGKVIQRNKDVVESRCRLASNAAKVLYGSKVK